MGDANIFWSHAQAEKVSTTLAGMVDYFTLKQNANGEFAPPDVLAIIEMIGHTVMVASPWNAPTTLVEVICTGKVPFLSFLMLFFCIVLCRLV